MPSPDGCQSGPPRNRGGLGIVRPLKMLPIVLLEIFYKVLWLILVAYPLWSKGKLTGSPAEGIKATTRVVSLPGSAKDNPRWVPRSEVSTA